jgi:hypothetical protein
VLFRSGRKGDDSVISLALAYQAKKELRMRGSYVVGRI